LNGNGGRCQKKESKDPPVRAKSAVGTFPLPYQEPNVISVEGDDGSVSPTEMKTRKWENSPVGETSGG